MVSAQTAKPQANPVVTYENLNEFILPEQRQALSKHPVFRTVSKSYDKLLKAAQQGDRSAQHVLPMMIHSFVSEEIGLALTEHLYDTIAFDFQGSKYAKTIVGMYGLLGEEYLYGKHREVNFLKGLKILIEAANYGAPDVNLYHQLSQSKNLPYLGNWLAIWRKYKHAKTPVDLNELSVSFNAVSAVESRSESEYIACGGHLNDISQIMAKFSALQESMLKDGAVTQAEIDAAYDIINQAFPAAPGFSPYMSAMSDDIKSQLASMANGKTLVTDAKLSLFWMQLGSHHMMSPLIVASLNEHLKLEFKCAGRSIMIKSNVVADLDPAWYFLPGFVKSVEVSGSTNAQQTGTITWENSHYTGDLKNNLPDGRGLLTFVTDDRGYERTVKIKGQFKQGKPHGHAEMTRDDQQVGYQGEYKNGLYHGEGHYFNRPQGLDFSGRFEYGGYSGVGTYYLSHEGFPNYTDKSKLIRYDGPIKWGVPHGKGQCQAPELSYACQFHLGFLIGIEDFSLLPVAGSKNYFE